MPSDLIRRSAIFSVCLGALFTLLILSGTAQAAVMLTEAGLKYRIITKRQCPVYQRPDETSRFTISPALRYWFVLTPPQDSEADTTGDKDSLVSNGFYRVASGDSEEDFKGYIRARDAQVWTHQQVLKLTHPDTRGTAYFYSTKEDALGALRSGDSSRALFREPHGAWSRLTLMPILDVVEGEAGGQRARVYKTTMLTAPDEDPGQGWRAVNTGDIREKSTIDIVFVVKTMVSMGFHLRELAEAVRITGRRLMDRPELAKRIRYGLVAYRDTAGSPNLYDYSARVFCTLEEGRDHGLFLERLAKLTLKSSLNADMADDVLAGVGLALDPKMIGWNPLAWKNIFIVGDTAIKSPDHPDPRCRENSYHLTIPEIVTRAQTGGDSHSDLQGVVTINALYSKWPDMPRLTEIALRQFRELVAGRGYPGVLWVLKSGSEPDDLTTPLSRELLQRYDNFWKMVVEGKEGPDMIPGSPATAMVPLPLLRLIYRAGEIAYPDITTLSTEGYLAEYDREGSRVVVPHLWVRKKTLKSYCAFLDFLVWQLESAGEPGSRNIPQISRHLSQIAVGLNLQEPLKAEIPIEKLFKISWELPFRGKIFNVTPRHLAAMTQVDFNNWLMALKRCSEILQALMENPSIWRRFDHFGRDGGEYAFISLTDLP